VMTSGKGGLRPRSSGLGTACAGNLVMRGGSNRPVETTPCQSLGDRRRFPSPAMPVAPKHSSPSGRTTGTRDEPFVTLK
jgi:hypothetical protein